MFEGSIPAVITPFDKNEEIDFDSLESHIEFLISEGSHGLVSCGTTGESPTLDHDEHKIVTEFIINKSKGRVPVMAGCGSNSTKESIDFVHHAYKSGAKATLLVTPYYNKPTQKGLYEHFRLIANSCPKIPNYLYNIPGRSVVRLEIDTLKKLSQISNIVGVKDATADLTTPLEVRTNCKESFQQLSGEDATFLSFLISGGVGCIFMDCMKGPHGPPVWAVPSLGALACRLLRGTGSSGTRARVGAILFYYSAEETKCRHKESPYLPLSGSQSLYHWIQRTASVHTVARS